MINTRWLPQVFANAVVRKLAYVAVALVLGWCSVGKASAAVPDYSYCDVHEESGYCNGEQTSYSMALKWANVYKEEAKVSPSGANPQAVVCPNPTRGGPSYGGAYGNLYSITYKVAATPSSCGSPIRNISRTWPESSEQCDAQHPIDPSTGQCGCPGGYKRGAGGQCMDENKCKDLNRDIDVNVVRDFRHAVGGASNSYCPASGCEFVRTGITNTTCKPGSVVVGGCVTSGSWNYSGASCSVGTAPPPPPEMQDLTQPLDPNRCVGLDGNNDTVCVRPNDKKICAEASTGKKVCWKPGETGEKGDGEILQKKDPGDTPIPPKPLDSGDNLVQIGDPKKVDSTNTNNANGTSQTSHGVITNYRTGNGSDAKPGAGNGSGSDAEGEGEGDDDEDGDGAPGPDVEGGRMPGAEGRTVDGVVGAFKGRIGGAPIVSAASGFFTVSAGGACPSWTIPATDWSPAIVMDFWCRPELQTAWTMFGFVMLIVFGWAAFRIALL